MPQSWSRTPQGVRGLKHTIRRDKALSAVSYTHLVPSSVAVSGGVAVQRMVLLWQMPERKSSECSKSRSDVGGLSLIHI